MLKAEFSTPITVAELEALHDNTGLVVEINDGEITNTYIE